MAIARCRLYSPDYEANEQVVKSHNFELGPSANRQVRSHCPDNETHSTQPTISVASDQLFTAVGQIYSDRRCSMPGENAENLCSLRIAFNCLTTTASRLM